MKLVNGTLNLIT